MAKATLAANRRKRRARKNPGSSTARANPPVGQDLINVVLPGFASYAATRFFSRIVRVLISKKFPKLAKHAGAIAAAGAFGGTWFFAHKIKRLGPYHDGVLVGSGIAALQTVAQTYLPAKYSYIVSDYQPQQISNGAPANGTGKQLPPTEKETPTAQGWDEYSHLEAELDAMGAPPSSPKTTRAWAPKFKDTAPAVGDFISSDDDNMNVDLEDELGDDENLEDFYAGSFAENTLN